MKKLILVDENDQKIGRLGKMEAHLGRGRRHRAFTAILKNNNNEILLCKRSLKKPLWPAYWDLSFSSHPWVGETLEQACERRAGEELRIEIEIEKVKIIISYEYHKKWNEVFSEWEINHILLARYNGELKSNPDEISEWKWMEWDKAVEWIKKNPKIIAPWVKIAVEKIDKDSELRRDFYK